MSKKNFLVIYALLVCLISVIVSGCLSATLVYDVIGVAWPQYTMAGYIYNQHADNDAYTRYAFPCYGNTPNCRKPPEDEKQVTELRLKAFDQAIESERRTHIQSIIHCIPFLIMFITVGLFHRRIYRNTKEA